MPKKLVKSNEYDPIFNRLIDICNDKNTSISNLLDKFTSSRSAINAWKKGNINIGVLIKVIEYLNITPEYLLTGKEKTFDVDLTADEQELLETYRKLTDANKTRLAERGLTLAEQQETVET